MNILIKDLNEAQKEAVLSFGMPQLVLSGAGSGKTRVLTYKIIFLITSKNILPGNILALTFTNKAANEMKERINKLIGDKYSQKLVMGTFHSVFCKILRKNINYLEIKKYKPDFKIIVEHESRDIINKIIKENFNDDFEKYLESKDINDNFKRKVELTKLTKKIKKKISLLKNKGISYEKYLGMEEEIQKDESEKIPFFKSVYRLYVLTCQDKNVMDFDDLLFNTLLLFNDKNNEKILEYYQNKFEYILVDEYQDTNIVQFEIIKALAWKFKNIFVVGDDYQNIYSFRGASKLNIDKFKQYFTNYRETKLCQNYRSNSTIVELANKLIKNNKKQIIKELFSTKKEIDGKVKLLICENGMDEANKIAFLIKDLIMNNKCNYKDIVILYRINKQHGPFKTTFFKNNIPHKIYNSKSIFESIIVKIIYYYLRYIDDQTSDYSLEKIINFPKRNIGKATVNKLFLIAKSKRISCWEIINNCDNDDKIKEFKITKDLLNKLLPFKNLISGLINFAKTNDVSKIIDELIKNLGLNEYLKDEHSIEQIEMMKDKIEELEAEHNKMSIEKFTLKEFLEGFSILVGNDENDEDENEKDRVKLMTIHQSKGLEFKYVFVVGLEEGYYPCCSFLKDEDGIEEERRIFYVAITRTKINCFLSYAKERIEDSEKEKRFKSRFLEEISDSDCIETYEFENDDNYNIYKNKYKNEFKVTKRGKNKKLGKIRKYDFFQNSDEEDDNRINDNYIGNYGNLCTKNFNGRNATVFQKGSNFVHNQFEIKFDIMSIKNMNYDKIVKTSLIENTEINKKKENLINYKNSFINGIDKKENKKNEKNKSQKKNKNKTNLKFKTIDSFFNLK